MRESGTSCGAAWIIPSDMSCDKPNCGEVRRTDASCPVKWTYPKRAKKAEMQCQPCEWETFSFSTVCCWPLWGFFPQNQPLHWGRWSLFSFFFFKRERKDFHLDYNLEIFFCASLLACRTLFTRFSVPYRNICRWHRTARAQTYTFWPLCRGRVVSKRGTGNKMERCTSSWGPEGKDLSTIRTMSYCGLLSGFPGNLCLCILNGLGCKLLLAGKQF